MSHALEVKASLGFGPGREYHNGTCECGWAAGSMNVAQLTKLHILHVAEFEEAALRKSPPTFYQVRISGETHLVPAADVFGLYAFKDSCP